MNVLYECNERTCYNRVKHFHSNQCYVSCVECYPPSKPVRGSRKSDDKVFKVLFSLLIASLLMLLVKPIFYTYEAVTGRDGTYQQCLLPVEEYHGFDCNNITKEEYYEDYKLDGSIAPDGRKYWYVSFE